MKSLFGRSAWYLLASIAGAAVSVAVLPFATRIIGADEYGALAIAMALATLATATAAAAIGYVLSEHYLVESSESRGEIAAAALLASWLGAVAAGFILLAAAQFLLPHVLDIDERLAIGIRICLLGAVIGAPWVVCSEVLILEGRAAAFAAGVVGQALVNGAVVLGLLYVHPLPDLALFVGNAAGQGVLLLVGLIALGRTVRRPRDRRWFAAMRSKAVAVGRASLAESGRSLFERSYLGAWTTVAAVGLFSHAQLYRNWAMMALNAVSRAVWPVNLREAHEEDPTFPVTRASWSVVQAGIAGGGMAFVLFGREIIALLTSGKFVEATPYAIVLLASLLVQTAGKPNMVLLIARGHGQHVANAATAGTITGVCALAALVPWWGPMGAATAVMVQMIVTRGLTVWFSRRLGRLPFTDAWVLIGLAAMAGLFVWTHMAAPGILPRSLVLAAAAVVVLAAIRRPGLVFLRYRSLPPGRELPSDVNGSAA